MQQWTFEDASTLCDIDSPCVQFSFLLLSSFSLCSHLKEPVEELRAHKPQHGERSGSRNHWSGGAEGNEEEANGGAHEANPHYGSRRETVSERASDERAAGVGEHKCRVH